MGQSWDGVVKLRGLPFEGQAKDVENFFHGLQFIPNTIFCPRNDKGQSNGEAYIQFQNYDSANAALQKNKQEIHGRYMEIFKSSNSELRRAMILDLKARYGQPQAQPGNNNVVTPSNAFGGLIMNGQGGGPMRNGMGGPMGGNRPAPYQKPQSAFGSFGGFGGPQNTPQPQQAPPQVKQESTANNPFPHCVGMSGIPMGLTNQAVQEFFKPHRAIAVNMPPGGNSGMVAFKTHQEACNAMGKNGQPIMGVGIQLTLKSTAPAPANQGWAAT